MITLNGNDTTQTDPHRHKFDSAIAEYIHDNMDTWADSSHGDAESPIGWFAQVGKRILRGDSQGFVWVEKFGNEHQASMIVRALRYYDGALSAWEWMEDDAPEPDSVEHEAMIERADRYLAYSYSCDAESCNPHDWDMWLVHGEPSAAI